ncbi:MAG: putative zinc-binding peptidase [Alphaproteobacteria bacterium]|nr:putative zinc-binding peptidase [Alphaproteobacteria bacterium]
MRLFSCEGCGQLLYFENWRCEACGRLLGFLPDRGVLTALEADGTVLAAPQTAYRFCQNNGLGVCNWMVAQNQPEEFCVACRHNHLIPDLSVPGNDRLWARIEAAKHRLFYSLLRLGLPLENRADNPDHGLAFDFLADPSAPHAQGVMTGHNNGLITLALKEADDVVREKVRREMGEPYRTLLGHLRHESGHYFWDRLVAPDEALRNSFRALFGDDRADYGAALKAHYAQGASADWQQSHISAYATSHPFEDFAETWAHYLHIVDTLETAAAFGLKVRPRLARGHIAATIDFDPYDSRRFDQIIEAWLPVEFATNSMNRSMGLSDLYPFLLSEKVIEKLGFVHALMWLPMVLRQTAAHNLIEPLRPSLA